jgi:CspA family cold shock protein
MEPEQRGSPRNRYRAFVCQRCGLGFIATSTYLDFLQRWGAKVIVPVQCPNCFWTQGPLPKREGKVKWFSQRKRYGFIVSKDGTEVFVHQQQLLDDHSAGSLKGTAVQFHVQSSTQGPEALNVERAEGRGAA